MSRSGNHISQSIYLFLVLASTAPSYCFIANRKYNIPVSRDLYGIKSGKFTQVWWYKNHRFKLFPPMHNVWNSVSLCCGSCDYDTKSYSMNQNSGENEFIVCCSPLPPEPTGWYWNVPLCLTMSMWYNGLTGCLLCITCGVPDSWSCEFNSYQCWTFLIFHFQARLFFNNLASLLNQHGDSLPSPWNLGANLILEYLP